MNSEFRIMNSEFRIKNLESPLLSYKDWLKGIFLQGEGLNINIIFLIKKASFKQFNFSKLSR